MEYVREHQSVMDLGTVFVVVVAEVGAYRGSVNLEVVLTGTIPDPVEAHVDCL